MVATGSPSVAQVWSLWLALMRFTWERRGFPPFLLEVFNNYIYYTIYAYMYISIINISKQGCKRNSPIHCAMVGFLTVIQRECFALHTYYSTRHFLATPLHSSRSTTVHPLSATFCGNTLNILWILSPPLTQPLTPSERMMIDASGRFTIWKSTARMPKHWKKSERIPSNLCGQTHSCMSGKEQNKQGTLIWSLILSTQLTRQNKILAHGCHGRPSPQDFPIR